VAEQKKLSGVETLKEASHGLRGRLAEELAEGGIQVSEDAYNLLKFHGSYEQFDRDTATARKQQKLEKEYQFMVRVRIPGGALTADRYLALDSIADQYANGTLRITTRQGIQFHGILKGELKPSIAAINHGLMTTMSACGDVVRNLMGTPAPRRDARHAQVRADVELLSQALLPKSRAYYQIFLDEQPVAGADEEETLFGPTYLPRKFKIGIALPDDNSVDVLSNDLGVIAHFDANDRLEGYTIAVGGGLGMTHNNARTFPRLATPVCFVPPGELLAICEAVIRLQRDHGDRGDRRRARLKYVVQDRGIEWIADTLAGYFGRPLTPPRPLPSLYIPELLGWHEQGDGMSWLGVPVLAGRIQDDGTVRLRTALRTIVTRFGVDPVFTAQQDVLLTNVKPADRGEIDLILREHGVTPAEDMTPFARFALACPALPTCGLALTEAERVHAPLVEMFEALLAQNGLSQERISLRVTGCPNGCARSYAGDIGLVGRVPGFYAIYVGGDFNGTRLSFRLLDRVAQGELGNKFAPLLQAFARDRVGTEGFGDFCDRLGRDALLALTGDSDSKAA
jgi:sulfite reductase (ferredoxin)